MTPDDWAVIGDRVVLILCVVAIVLYACGVIR